MTDQQRGGTILPGSPYKAITPYLDQLRAEGVTFSEAHCPSPHCCPSRATFFTGLYPSQHGVWNNVEVPNTLSTGLSPGVRLWSETLRADGYGMYFSGKWHVSALEGPQDRGWDTKETLFGEAAGYSSSRDADGRKWKNEWAVYESDPGMEVAETRPEGAIIRPGYGLHRHYGTHPDKFGDGATVKDAVRGLQHLVAGDKPWCLYAGTLGPHDPYFVPQEYLDLYPLDSIVLPDNFRDLMPDKPALYRRTRAAFDQLSEREHRESLRHYLAFCSFQDDLFGELLEALEVSGQADNTIVVYCSDHGDYTGEHGLWTKGLPCFKGAYHIPLVVRDPRPGRAVPGSTVNALVSLADIGPTIAEWTGTEAPAASPGRSLVLWLQSARPNDWRDAIFTQTNGNELYGIQRSIFTREWKFVYNGFDFDEFYDLRADPGEQVNLIKEPEIQHLADEGMRRIWKFAHETNDKNTNSYIMVGLARLGPGAAFTTPDQG